MLCYIITFAVSCKKDVIQQADFTLKENILSLQAATKIAQAYLQKHSVDSSKPVTIQNNEIIARNGIPYMYAFNAANNAGFIVLSAEKNNTPILAHNKIGTFNHGEGSPWGLQSWLTSTENYIDTIRDGTWRNTHTIIAMSAWKALEKDLKMPEIGNDEYLSKLSSQIIWPTATERANNLTNYWSTMPVPTPTITIIGPLIGTIWGQGCGYNDFCPGDGAFCGRPPTGCVPTAIAQVMYYWRWPQNIDWGAMSPGGPSTETARLMADIGGAEVPGRFGFPKSFVTYNFGSSSANPANNPRVLKNSFNYSTADYTNSGSYRLYQDIENGWPIMMGGHTRDAIPGAPFSWATGDGHLWVAEGVFSYYMYWPMIGTIGFTQLYLNWGWDGRSNGWYSQYAPTGTGFNFQYYNTVTYNIHP